MCEGVLLKQLDKWVLNGGRLVDWSDQHSSSLPVASSCGRLHGRNAELRSVIVSAQWAWHGRSVKNNSFQKQVYVAAGAIREPPQRPFCSPVTWLWNWSGDQHLLKPAADVCCCVERIHKITAFITRMHLTGWVSGWTSATHSTSVLSKESTSWQQI